MFIGPLSAPFLYYFSHPDTVQSREKIIEFSSKMLGLIFGFISLFLFAFANEIVMLLFGKNYYNSISVLRFFSLNLFMLGYTILFNPYFSSINKPILPTFLGIFNFLLFFIFNLLFIPSYKSLGPAISIFIVETIFAVIMVSIISKSIIKCFKNFIILYICIIISVISGLFITYYISLLLFIISIFLTKLFSFSDIKLCKKLITDYTKKTEY